MQIEQVMKYAPITDKNHIAYGMMFKLALSFVVLYRSVTKYLFLEFDRRLDARTLANSLITGLVADRFLQYALLQSLFMLHSESLPQTMPPKLIVFFTKADTTTDKDTFHHTLFSENEAQSGPCIRERQYPSSPIFN